MCCAHATNSGGSLHKDMEAFSLDGHTGTLQMTRRRPLRTPSRHRRLQSSHFVGNLRTSKAVCALDAHMMTWLRRPKRQLRRPLGSMPCHFEGNLRTSTEPSSLDGYKQSWPRKRTLRRQRHLQWSPPPHRDRSQDEPSAASGVPRRRPKGTRQNRSKARSFESLRGRRPLPTAGRTHHGRGWPQIALSPAQRAQPEGLGVRPW